MKTGDMLAPSDDPSAQHRRDFDRRINWASVVVGSILVAGLYVMACAGAYSARPAQAVVDTDESEVTAFAKTLERSGTLSGLEILW